MCVGSTKREYRQVKLSGLSICRRVRGYEFLAESPNYGLEIHIAGRFATTTVAKPAKAI